jgi:hypothetical protein
LVDFWEELMIDKILIFASWLTAGIGAVSFISLVCRFSPGFRIPILLLLAAILVIFGTVSFFAAGVRPWIVLILSVVLVGGCFAWLL